MSKFKKHLSDQLGLTSDKYEEIKQLIPDRELLFDMNRLENNHNYNHYQTTAKGKKLIQNTTEEIKKIYNKKLFSDYLGLTFEQYNQLKKKIPGQLLEDVNNVEQQFKRLQKRKDPLIETIRERILQPAMPSTAADSVVPSQLTVPVKPSVSDRAPTPFLNALLSTPPAAAVSHQLRQLVSLQPPPVQMAKPRIAPEEVTILTDENILWAIRELCLQKEETGSKKSGFRFMGIEKDKEFTTLHNLQRLFSDIEFIEKMGPPRKVTITKAEHKFKIQDVFVNTEDEETGAPILVFKLISAPQVFMRVVDEETTLQSTLWQEFKYDMKSNTCQLLLTGTDINGKKKINFNFQTTYKINRATGKIILDPYVPPVVIDTTNAEGGEKSAKEIAHETYECLDSSHILLQEFQEMNATIKSLLNVWKYLNTFEKEQPVTFNTSLPKLKAKLDRIKMQTRAVMDKYGNYIGTETGVPKAAKSNLRGIEKILANTTNLEEHKAIVEAANATWNSWLWENRKNLQKTKEEQDEKVLKNEPYGTPHISRTAKAILDLYKDMNYLPAVALPLIEDVIINKKDTRGSGEAHDAHYTHLTKNFGLRVPYLVSYILRYNQKISGYRSTIERLALTPDNIIEFSEFIHMFRSVAFNIISLINMTQKLRVMNKDANIQFTFNNIYQHTMDTLPMVPNLLKKSTISFNPMVMGNKYRDSFAIIEGDMKEDPLPLELLKVDEPSHYLLEDYESKRPELQRVALEGDFDVCFYTNMNDQLIAAFEKMIQNHKDDDIPELRVPQSRPVLELRVPQSRPVPELPDGTMSFASIVKRGLATTSAAASDVNVSDSSDPSTAAEPVSVVSENYKYTTALGPTTTAENRNSVTPVQVLHKKTPDISNTSFGQSRPETVSDPSKPVDMFLSDIKTTESSELATAAASGSSKPVGMFPSDIMTTELEESKPVNLESLPLPGSSEDDSEWSTVTTELSPEQIDKRKKKREEKRREKEATEIEQATKRLEMLAKLKEEKELVQTKPNPAPFVQRDHPDNVYTIRARHLLKRKIETLWNRIEGLKREQLQKDKSIIEFNHAEEFEFANIMTDQSTSEQEKELLQRGFNARLKNRIKHDIKAIIDSNKTEFDEYIYGKPINNDLINMENQKIETIERKYNTRMGQFENDFMEYNKKTIREKEEYPGQQQARIEGIEGKQRSRRTKKGYKQGTDKRRKAREAKAASQKFDDKDE